MEQKHLTLLIKPTSSLCNMKCDYCFYADISNRRTVKNYGLLSRDNVKLLLHRVKEFSPTSLAIIFQGGEPTLWGLENYEYFTQIFSTLTTDTTITYSLQTNGILIDDNFAIFLKKHNFLVGISLDGIKDTHDKHRIMNNGENSFDKALNATEMLKKHNVDFNILTVINNYNAQKIEEIYNYYKLKRFNFLQFIPCINNQNDDLNLNTENLEFFLKKLFDLYFKDIINKNYISIRSFDNYVKIILGEMPDNCAMNYTCGVYFVIEGDGSVFPCDFYCIDEYKINNLSQENIFLVNHEHMKFLQESKMLNKKCLSCKYIYMCRCGCKKNRDENKILNHCKAYYNFFEYAMPRLKVISKIFVG